MSDTTPTSAADHESLPANTPSINTTTTATPTTPVLSADGEMSQPKAATAAAFLVLSHDELQRYFRFVRKKERKGHLKKKMVKKVGERWKNAASAYTFALALLGDTTEKKKKKTGEEFARLVGWMEKVVELKREVKEWLDEQERREKEREKTRKKAADLVAAMASCRLLREELFGREEI